MFGKFFASTFTGSMYGAGPQVFSVWAYVIAHTVNSQVELNPRFLAPILGMSEEDVAVAIAYLSADDPNSRSKDFDGKRLLREGQFAYRVPSANRYRDMRDEEERRKYNRHAQRKQRAKSTTVKQPVKNVNVGQEMSTLSAQAEAEAYTETNTKPQDQNQKHVSHFVRPCLDEVRAYFAEKGSHIDPEQFHSYYESNGWKVGRSSMKSWRAALVTWEKRSKERTNGHRITTAQQKQKNTIDGVNSLLRDLGVDHSGTRDDSCGKGSRSLTGKIGT